MPLLGICLGMQWLFEGSEEAPELPGLGLLAGRADGCRPERPTADQDSARRLEQPRPARATRRSSTASPIGAQVYFTHSFVAPVTGDTVAATDTASRSPSIVQRGQVAGVQFHPEKSGDVGLQILRNFLQMVG